MPTKSPDSDWYPGVSKATVEHIQPVSDTFPLFRITSVNDNDTAGGTSSIKIVKYSNSSAGETNYHRALVKVYDETTKQHRRKGELQVLRYLAGQDGADKHFGLMDQNWQALQEAGFSKYKLPSDSLYFQFEVGTSDMLHMLGQIDMPGMIEVAKQLGDALKFLQIKCIWHRDIKVENVIVVDTVGGKSYKIIDFGFSKIVDPDKLINRCDIRLRHGGICGTRHTFSANVLMQCYELSMPEEFNKYMRSRSILEEDEWGLCITLWGLANSDIFGDNFDGYEVYSELVEIIQNLHSNKTDAHFFQLCYTCVTFLLNSIVHSIESSEESRVIYQTTKEWLESLACKWQGERGSLMKYITTQQSHSYGGADDSSSDTIEQSSESPKPPIATQPSHSDGSADDSDDSDDSVVSDVAGGSSCDCMSLFCKSSKGSGSNKHVGNDSSEGFSSRYGSG